MSAIANRAWVLRSRPQEHVAVDDFEYRDDIGLPADIGDNQILVRNRLFSCAPTIRNWLNEPGKSYRGSITIGDPIQGLSGAEVLQSRHPEYAVGDLVTAISPWQDFAVLSPHRAPVPVTRMEEGMGLLDAMTLYSSNSLTAFAGLVEVGRVRAGETVMISGAAGSVGAMACQIARNLNCRVIGIAGGEEKCRWLRDHCQVEAVDYKAGNLREQISSLGVNKVNLFFDNVGGEALDVAVDFMAPFGRIVISGQVSSYDGTAIARGPDMMKLVYGRLQISGFLVGDYAERYSAMWEQLRTWSQAGQISVRVDRREGFCQLPVALVDLFRGSNQGTLLVDVS